MIKRTGIFLAYITLVVLGWVGIFKGQPPSPIARKTLRVMTYNIHVGMGIDQRLDLERIAGVINRERTDLVGLQEVDRGVRRTQGIDEIVELSKLTGMNYAFGHNLDFQGGQYGIGILSRLPIRSTEHRKFENRRETERRGLLKIEVELGGRLINFVTTHLDYQFPDGRLFEAQQLLRALEDLKGVLIVAGDFNDEPGGEAYKLLMTKFEDAWIGSKVKQSGLSYPADKLAKRIDYIFYRPADGVRARKAWTVRSLASDHLPVVAELEMR